MVDLDLDLDLLEELVRPILMKAGWNAQPKKNEKYHRIECANRSQSIRIIFQKACKSDNIEVSVYGWTGRNQWSYGSRHNEHCQIIDFSDPYYHVKTAEFIKSRVRWCRPWKQFRKEFIWDPEKNWWRKKA